jgi:hypothetical protein
LFILPSARNWISFPARSYTAIPPTLSVPITVLRAGSVGCSQIAGSSAASPECGTGSVSTVAEVVSETDARAVAHRRGAPSSHTR